MKIIQTNSKQLGENFALDLPKNPDTVLPFYLFS